MGTREKLIIHNLNFDIELDDESQFRQYADRISRLVNNQLTARIESILEKFDLLPGDLVINHLEIDLGQLQNHNFEKVILNAITAKIEAFLYKNINKIKQEVAQAKFRPTSGGKLEVKDTGYSYVSDQVTERSVLLTQEIKRRRIDTVDLSDIIIKKGYEIVRKKGLAASKKIGTDEAERSLMKVKKILDQVRESIQLELKKEVKQKPASLATKETEASKPILELPKRNLIITKSDPISDAPITKRLPTKEKQFTPLDQAFVYYLKYGRLSSNIKYELGTSMLDVFKISQQEDGFLEQLSRQIKNDEKAKERLGRLLDQNKGSSDFDPRIPKAFEDYFAALIHDLPLDTFRSEVQRYNMNDMIRFLYADHPGKLKELIRYLLIDFDPNKSMDELIDHLFKNIHKASVVKLISSFARKGAYVNKSLNQLNKDKGKNERARDAHKELLKLLLTDSDTRDYPIDVQPRRFLTEPAKYARYFYNEAELIDYYFKYGSIPYSSGARITIDRIDGAILSLQPIQIKNLSVFKNNGKLHYETLGNLRENALQHIVKALDSKREGEIKNKYLYFKHNIRSGIPETFQKAFMVYYAAKENRKSYLEEMVVYWKEQFGDADKVIRDRWKLTEEVDKELNLFLNLTATKLEDELKVDFVYNKYSKDISVKNAGLVILWPFLKAYFNLLDLLDSKGNFRSMDERARACHLLQYLAIKRSYGEEFYYPLNKILTGYPLEEPLPYEIKMTEKEIDVSNALLNNVLRQWNALKGSSVDGFRGSFLIRDGILTPSTNGWLLTVEKKAYDILMDKLPWGIGMIKLSWAPYALSVEWERNIM